MDVSDSDALSRADMRIERLAWLACRDEMERRSRRWYESFARVLSARGSEVTVSRAGRMYPTVSRQMTDADRTRRLGVLEFAVDDVARRLSVSEQAELRVNGVLPSWFIGAVLKHAKAIEREMAKSRYGS
jgi:hypothetical protein